MRLDNIKVTFKSKLPINEPNRNGIMYTRDAVIKAYEESRNRVLIEFSNVEGEFVPIGIAQELELIEEDGNMYVTGCGLIYHGGTKENVEMENNTVNNFTITGIGIARK